MLDPRCGDGECEQYLQRRVSGYDFDRIESSAYD